MNDGHMRPAIEIQRQTAFTASGELEVSEEAVETSLEDFGADVDHRNRETRLDEPEATTFGVDDRPTVVRTSDGEQSPLFANTEDDQQTLDGGQASDRCLFEKEG